MHDLERIRRDLHEGLSLDKHPVALLIGAGCPVAVRVPDGNGGTAPLIPDIAGLTQAVGAALAEDASYQRLVEQFAEDGRGGYTLEDLLSHVRLLSRIVGAGEARGLSATKLRALEKELCDHVARSVRKTLPGDETPYHDLAHWIGAIRRTTPVHLFTTNYDLLLEQALEEREQPYFDGFVGARRPFFDLRAIEDDVIPPRWCRLWKLHGSISWRLVDDGVVVRSLEASGPGELLIHPSELKYDQSRRMPYLAMLDRLREFLRQSSAFLVTVGYSYADEHLNEVLLQGLRSNPTAAGFGLLFRTFDEERAARTLVPRLPANLTLIARDQGVVRGTVDSWAQASSSLGSETHSSGGDGKAESHLGDFAVFAAFLRSLGSSRDGFSHA